MVSRQRTILKWVFYSALVLLAMLLQTSVVGGATLLGVQFCIVPVAVACIAAREVPDSGALFGLLCGVFWSFSGVSYGPVYVLTLTLAGLLCGLACALWMRRSFATALVLSFGAVLLCEGCVCIFLIATGEAPMTSLSQTLLPTCFISLIFTPLFHLGAGAIAKLGGNYGA